MKKHRLIKFTAALFLCCALFGCKPEEEEKFGTIYGTVTDFATGEPVSNANVKLRPNGETTLTGNDGTYEFIDLEAGKYSLLLSKAQYADLDDDYIIELAAGKQVKRDVQLRKKVASLQIVDMSGNPLDTLDFGDAESVKVKTFNVFNDGTETLTCSVTYDCEWITNVSGLENQIQAGQTAPVTVKIDRVALADGVNTTFLYITSANGSNELVVKASFLGMPAITTKEPTEVTSNSATVAGKITDDGGRPVLVRGICYGTSQSPDISGNHTEDGSGTGDFGHNITGLSAATTYYARAYATNRNGTYYASNIVSFTTTSGLPTVTTDNVTNITTTSAKCGGNVTNNGGYNVTARGICWNTIGGPDLNDEHTTNGSGNGAFTANLTGLEPYVTYYVRAYATNQVGTSYGEEMSFTTNDGSITVTTKSVTDITPTSATCGGVVSVSSGNTFPITARGVCWSTNHNPSTSADHTSDGSGAGEFSSSISGLTANNTYYVRAYATNQLGTFYGEEKSFITNDGSIIVTTSSISSITPTSAMSGGEVTVPSGNTFPVTARGVCWSTSYNPTTIDSHTSDGSGAGSFTSSISGLTVNTTYYVRAYATNQQGTYYGDEKSFTTNDGSIIVTTSSISNITPTSAMSGGEITVPSGNTFPVTARGVCWSTSHNPTTEDSHTSDGSGAGSFTSLITGLSVNTTYYVRAYAINPLGTFYAQDEKSFITTSGLPSVTTNNVTDIAPLSAVGGGVVNSDNGFTVTCRGVCWSTVQNPTIDDEHTINGSGTGTFSSSITNLQNSTTYYVRAYATNEKGTAYGDNKVFTTTSGTITVTTCNVTEIGPAYATCGGDATVSGDNNLPITAKGVCWSTNHNPTINNNHTMDGQGTGAFVSSITELSVSTTYYVRAYATNQIDTFYGDEREFSTTDGLATVILDVNSFELVSSTSISCTSNVSSDGGLAVTERGVCWGTVPYPTIGDNHTNDGGGTGYYSSVISGLGSNTTYYVRSFATNSAGTSYSEQFVINSEFFDYLSLPRIEFDGHTYVIYPDLGSCMTWEFGNSACENLNYAGFTDWFLPDKDELYMMYLNKDNIGGWSTGVGLYIYCGEGPYWSSSMNGSYAYRYGISFENGIVFSENINSNPYTPQCYVRPVRKFD